MKWLIYSREHRGWWRPGWKGYTDQEEIAGRYTESTAREICEKAGKQHNDNGPMEFCYPAPESLAQITSQESEIPQEQS